MGISFATHGTTVLDGKICGNNSIHMINSSCPRMRRDLVISHVMFIIGHELAQNQGLV